MSDPESPSVLWHPPADREATAMGRFLSVAAQASGRTIGSYEDLHRWSVEEPEAFWTTLLKHVGLGYRGSLSPARREPGGSPGGNFFPDVSLNFTQNLLRSGESDPDKEALVSVSEGRATERITYGQLYARVAHLAHQLKEWGVQPGDRVAGYMPNIWETVAAMLATTSLGAVWSSSSPDFGAQGVVDRFGQIAPKVLFAANGYRYNGKTIDCLDTVARVADEIDSIEHIIIVPYLDDHPTGDYVAWPSLFSGEPPPLVFHDVNFNDPLYVMYSSGTTGKPKCIVHGVGGTLLQHAKELILHGDLRKEDTIFYFTTCGWMMWNWLVSSLFVGARVVLYEGSPGYPDLGALWRMAEKERVTHFGTSPKFLGACIGTFTPRGNVSLPDLRVVMSTGAPLLPEHFDWVYEHIKPGADTGLQLASISGGTDIISCFMLGCPLLPVYRGEIQCIGLGMDVAAMGDDDQPVVGDKGELACRQPFPSMPIYFWDDSNHERYRGAYFRGADPAYSPIWYHGDYVALTATQGAVGGVVVYGRSDATLNPGGVRIGTAEIYRLVEAMGGIEDSIVIGQPWDGDVRVVLFVQLSSGSTLDDSLKRSIRSTVRAGATPRHVPARIVAVDAIPYTISGKKVELAVRQIIEGEEPKNRDALKNPEALDGYLALRDELMAR